jgi:nucleoside-diphosphate-sugar epimerase
MQQRTNDEYSLVTAPVLVTGGTGRLGRLVVPRLREAGHHVRVLSRHDHESPRWLRPRRSCTSLARLTLRAMTRPPGI